MQSRADRFYAGVGSSNPLGNIWRLITVTLAALVTLALFYAKDLDRAASKKGRLQILLGTLALAVVGACAFLVADYHFVRTVQIPSLDKTVTVTVGYERTSFARSNFPQAATGNLCANVHREKKRFVGFGRAPRSPSRA